MDGPDAICSIDVEAGAPSEAAESETIRVVGGTVEAVTTEAAEEPAKELRLRADRAAYGPLSASSSDQGAHSGKI